MVRIHAPASFDTKFTGVGAWMTAHEQFKEMEKSWTCVILLEWAEIHTRN